MENNTKTDINVTGMMTLEDAGKVALVQAKRGLINDIFRWIVTALTRACGFALIWKSPDLAQTLVVLFK